jgi:hypothetical protein
MTTYQGRLPLEYRDVALEQLSITDLTDALGVAAAAKLLDTSCRSIYTVRNTNVLGIDRHTRLIDAVRANETACRQRLVVLRQRQSDKLARAKARAVA